MTESSLAMSLSKADVATAGLYGRISRWCRRVWLRARGGLRNANGKVAQQFTALSERQSSTRAEVQRLQSAFRELCANVDTLHARIHELETRERGAAPVRGGVALNLNTKGQVLKLSRNGQSVRMIADTLGVPVGEVEFLLKVHRLLNRAAERHHQPAGESGRQPTTASVTGKEQDKPFAAAAWETPRDSAGVQ